MNESKFLAEHLNLDEEPTEEEVVERAEELEIDDLGLARETLTKELDAMWKPYINRGGEVYYINLEERKAYLDHPIDMEAKISYALKRGRRVPVFKDFSLEQVAQSMELV